MLVSEDETGKKNIQKKKEEVLLLEEKMRKAHMERVGQNKCSVKMTAMYNGILHDIDRMGNSCVNLVDMALENPGMELLIEEV